MHVWNWPSKVLIPLSTALPEFRDFWSKDWCYIKLFRLEIWFGIGTVSMCWMDLELCTGVWCKNWPAKKLVPPSKVLDLWGKDLSYITIVQPTYLILILDCLLVLSGQSTPYVLHDLWYIHLHFSSFTDILRTHKVTSSLLAWYSQLRWQSISPVS